VAEVALLVYTGVARHTMELPVVMPFEAAGTLCGVYWMRARYRLRARPDGDDAIVRVAGGVHTPAAEVE
jgi:hypothetical protein